jgi:tRNA nucleotidyltransferase (CCA-adding enzyme)
LIPAALPVLAGLSGERVRHELEMVFREAAPARALARLGSLGALSAAHSALRWGEAETADCDMIATLPRPDWQWAGPLEVDSLYLALLLRGAAPAETDAALARLAVTRAVDMAVTGALRMSLTGERPSEVVAQLDRLSLDGIAAAYVLWPSYRERIDAYLARWRHVRAALTGDDLRRLGLAPGPEFKVILGRLRAARLDGEVADDEAERALARALAGAE